jgi:hypothetical protein
VPRRAYDAESLDLGTQFLLVRSLGERVGFLGWWRIRMDEGMDYGDPCDGGELE